MGVVDVVVPATRFSSPVSLAGAPSKLAFALGWALSGLRSRRRDRGGVRPAEETSPVLHGSPRAAALAESTYPHAGQPAPA